MRKSSHLISSFRSTTTWPNLAAIVVPRKSSRRKKTALSHKKTASLSKITLSGMWGDNTNGLSSTGLLRPTDSSSAIRRNYNYYYNDYSTDLVLHTAFNPWLDTSKYAAEVNLPHSHLSTNHSPTWFLSVRLAGGRGTLYRRRQFTRSFRSDLTKAFRRRAFTYKKSLSLDRSRPYTCYETKN